MEVHIHVGPEDKQIREPGQPGVDTGQVADILLTHPADSNRLAHYQTAQQEILGQEYQKVIGHYRATRNMGLVRREITRGTRESTFEMDPPLLVKGESTQAIRNTGDLSRRRNHIRAGVSVLSHVTGV